jgi:hypothetical protein
LQLHILSVGGVIATYIKFGLILLVFSLGSRLGFYLAITGLFCVIIQNLFCFC